RAVWLPQGGGSPRRRRDPSLDGDEGRARAAGCLRQRDTPTVRGAVAAVVSAVRCAHVPLDRDSPPPRPPRNSGGGPRGRTAVCSRGPWPPPALPRQSPTAPPA